MPKKVSKKAKKTISDEIKHLIKDKGYSQSQAVAAAYSVAKKKGFKVPKNKKK